MRAQQVETWTPDLVSKRLLAAVRWASFSGAKVGPGGIKGSMPAFNPTLDDHLEEGWGLPEVAGDDAPDDGKRLIVQATAAQISQYEQALLWPITYLHPSHEGSARMLCLWLRCKTYRRPFEEAVKRRGTMSRASAFRLRDRALSMISQGLDRDGVSI
jgi:hypothetical protein